MHSAADSIYYNWVKDSGPRKTILIVFLLRITEIPLAQTLWYWWWLSFSWIHLPCCFLHYFSEIHLLKLHLLNQKRDTLQRPPIISFPVDLGGDFKWKNLSSALGLRRAQQKDSSLPWKSCNINKLYKWWAGGKRHSKKGLYPRSKSCQPCWNRVQNLSIAIQY